MECQFEPVHCHQFAWLRRSSLLNLKANVTSYQTPTGPATGKILNAAIVGGRAGFSYILKSVVTLEERVRECEPVEESGGWK